MFLGSIWTHIIIPLSDSRVMLILCKVVKGSVRCAFMETKDATLMLILILKSVQLNYTSPHYIEREHIFTPTMEIIWTDMQSDAIPSNDISWRMTICFYRSIKLYNLTSYIVCCLPYRYLFLWYPCGTHPRNK